MPALLEVQHLCVRFPLRGARGGWLDAVKDVSLRLEAGCTLGVVGESGSGKSTLARCIMRLNAVHSGHLLFDGQRYEDWSAAKLQPLRRQMQMIFQDPVGSLNPRMSIESILAEPQEIHFPERSRQERRDTSARLLQRVGLPADSLQRRPHEFSGGQRQRIGIARALAVEPRLILCDEPVSALDVSVQASILNLLRDLQDELGLSLLFIAHDLAVVRHMSDEILVMHHGCAVEQGPADELCSQPREAYTRRLLQSVPTLEGQFRTP